MRVALLSTVRCLYCRYPVRPICHATRAFSPWRTAPSLPRFSRMTSHDPKNGRFLPVPLGAPTYSAARQARQHRERRQGHFGTPASRSDLEFREIRPAQGGGQIELEMNASWRPSWTVRRSSLTLRPGLFKSTTMPLTFYSPIFYMCHNERTRNGSPQRQSRFRHLRVILENWDCGERFSARRWTGV